MNREEISRIVNDVKGRICNDVRTQVTKLLRESGKTVETVANDLQLNANELRQIISGATNMSLGTFVKLMVATGNAIEVKNIVPQMSTRIPHGRPSNGRTVPPHPLTNETINQRHTMKRPCPMGVPPFEGQMHGRPMGMPSFEEVENRPRPWERPNVNELPTLSTTESALHEKSSNELINMIYTNGWDNEINILGASRSDLIDFLMTKMDGASNIPTVNEMPTVQPSFENDSTPIMVDSEKERIASGIADLIRSNPQIAEKLARFIPRN